MSNTEPTKKVYAGWIRLLNEACDGPDDILFVLPSNYPKHEHYLLDDENTLAWQIEAGIEAHGRYLSVQYFVSDVERDHDALQVAWLNRFEGIGDADYSVHWSEFTGYLWTDEEITVGGHDLLEELKSHEGKYLHLEIEYSKEPRSNEHH